jgi:hypothetical protein
MDEASFGIKVFNDNVCQHAPSDKEDEERLRFICNEIPSDSRSHLPSSFKDINCTTIRSTSGSGETKE